MTPFEFRCCDSVDSRLVRIAERGGTPDKNVYLNPDNAAHSWPKNPDCWGADFDVTCVSPYNESQGNLFNLTAIAVDGNARYAVGTVDSPLNTPTNCYWVGSDGASVVRATDQRATIAASFCLYRLASAMPATVTPATVSLRASSSSGAILNYVKYTLFPDTIPVVYLNAARGAGDLPAAGDLHASRHMRVGDYTPTSDTGTLTQSSDPLRAALWKVGYAGDSGSAMLLYPRTNQPILIAVKGSPNSGTPLWFYRNEINAQILSWG